MNIKQLNMNNQKINTTNEEDLQNHSKSLFKWGHPVYEKMNVLVILKNVGHSQDIPMIWSFLVFLSHPLHGCLSLAHFIVLLLEHRIYTWGESIKQQMKQKWSIFSDYNTSFFLSSAWQNKILRGLYHSLFKR